MIFDSGLSYVCYANIQCLHLAYYHVNDENINCTARAAEPNDFFLALLSFWLFISLLSKNRMPGDLGLLPWSSIVY